MTVPDDTVEERGDYDHDPDDVRRILRERAQALAVPRDESHSEEEELHLLTRVGDHAIAIPAVRIRHVVNEVPLAQLVDSSPAIIGLGVVQRNLVPVLDLGALLGTDRLSGRPRPGRLVIVDDGDWSLGLLVDDVEEVRSLSPGEVRDDLAASATAGALIAGVAHGGAFLLDVDQILLDERLWPEGAAPGAGDDRSAS